MLPNLDRIVEAFDTAIRTLLPPEHRSTLRVNPAKEFPRADLDPQSKKHIAGLMRVNHSGEVCAQALYQGQALTARLTQTREKMAQAAQEEVDHLSWCEERLQELSATPSRLNLLWYTGSFCLGAVAGLAGDQYSLGFVEETERQVSVHLQKHLGQLPAQDKRSKAILEQMLSDEQHHAEQAHNAGAASLPNFIKSLMGSVSKLMTRSSYYV